MGLPSAVDAVMFLLSLLLLASLYAVAGFTVFCKHPCFYWRPYCVGGPVVAFIPAVACVPAVVSGHDIAVILNFKTCQCGSKTNWVIPKLGISEAKQTRFSLKLGKIEAQRNKRFFYES